MGGDAPLVAEILTLQTALAVNTALMALMKAQVFCTEPFRVPLAGKIDACFFDKTGTITTDQLEATGIVPAQAGESASSSSGCRSDGEKISMAEIQMFLCISVITKEIE